MVYSLLAFTSLATLLLFWLRALSKIHHEQSEPPVVTQRVPLIGHLIGMLRFGSHYYTRVSKETGHPIYTLNIFRSKIYVVTSPRLASQVDRNAKTISFAPFLVLFVKRILVPSPKAINALSENIEEEGDWGCRLDTMKTIHATIAHGQDLEDITLEMLRSLCSQMCTMSKTGKGQKSTQRLLFAWVKKVVTRASTDAIYGPHNPFHYAKVEDGFWHLNHDFALLGLNIFPKWLASRAARGREDYFQGFHRYFAEGHHLSGSSLVRARYNVDQKHELSIDDTAHFELSISIGLLVNIVPTTFWCLHYLYSRPPLLTQIRDELNNLTEVIRNEDGQDTYHLDLAKAFSKCPLIGACIREILRLLSTNASGRVLLKDTVLDGEYLLKKDSVLLVPSAELHNDESVWGRNCKEFDPKRWLQSGSTAPASAYRAFGGGSWPCPGRSFSMNEMSAAIVLCVLQYELAPVSGVWEQVETAFHIDTSVLSPKKDIDIHFLPRKGFMDVDWSFYWKGDVVRSPAS